MGFYRLHATASSSVVHVDVISGYFGRILKLQRTVRPLTNQEKFFALSNHFVPPATFRFPIIAYGKQNRSFQHRWLSQYNGLVYSESDEGGYCKFCVLFGNTASSTPPGILVTRPLTNLQKASEKLREHFTGIGSDCACKSHLISVEKASQFTSVMQGEHLPIDQKISSIRAQHVEEKLKSIAETVIFCGRQGLALRGHRDDLKHLEESPQTNPGNFISLLHFRVQSGDLTLANQMVGMLYTRARMYKMS